MSLRARSALFAACALHAAAAGADSLAQYPTSLRVEYVLECMRDRDASQYELMHKCSCVLDRLGATMSVDDFVEGLTTAKAISIAGERGAALRDNAGAHAQAQAFLDAVATAERACFLQPRAR